MNYGLFGYPLSKGLGLKNGVLYLPASDQIDEWIIPDGVDEFCAWVIGGGGGGGGGNNVNTYGNGGTAGAAKFGWWTLRSGVIAPGMRIALSYGAGGAGGAISNPGSTGGTTSLGSLRSASGGSGGASTGGAPSPVANSTNPFSAGAPTDCNGFGGTGGGYGAGTAGAAGAIYLFW